MAKYCGNCGAELVDNAKVCGQCGIPVDGISARVSGLKTANLEKQKKIKKTVKLIGVLVVIVVVAVVGLKIASKFTGCNGLLRKVMTAYENYDIDMLISLSSDMYYYGEEDWVENYFEYSVGDDLDSFESTVGHSYKLSYEVDEIYPLSDRKLNMLMDTIESEYPDFDASAIKKVVVAEINVEAKQGDNSVERDLSITMTKEGSSWKLLYIE